MNPISLASGIIPEATAPESVRAAAEGGFDMVGLWVEPDKFTPDVIRETKAVLADTQLPVLDVEVIIIKPGEMDADHLRALDIGMELGARHALAISNDPDHGATAAKLKKLCAHVAGSDMRVSLEFMIFTEVKSLKAALDIIAMADDPRAGLLLDPLHIDRAGTDLSDLHTLPRHVLPYAQFCDGPKPGPDTSDLAAAFDDAVDGRDQLGEGGLPLSEIFSALPKDIPLSIELRSKALRDGWPDLVDRARVTAVKTRAWLEGQSAMLRT